MEQINKSSTVQWDDVELSKPIWLSKHNHIVKNSNKNTSTKAKTASKALIPDQLGSGIWILS